MKPAPAIGVKQVAYAFAMAHCTQNYDIAILVSVATSLVATPPLSVGQPLRATSLHNKLRSYALLRILSPKYLCITSR